MDSQTASESLGRRMKRWEHAYRDKVAPQDYLLMRLDGRAFHSYTRGLNKPFDSDLMAAMDATMLALCNEIDGVKLAFVQSDEISLVITNWRYGEPTPGNASELRFAEPWMGGVQAKLLSVSAALASVTFNQVRATQGHPGGALFDLRLWSFPGDDMGRSEVDNYLRWRQRDTIKNSVTMAASVLFPHSRLQGVRTEAKKQMLAEAGQPWEELPAGFRQGRIAVRRRKSDVVTYTNRRTNQSHEIAVERNPFTVEDAPLISSWTSWHIPSAPAAR